MNVKHIFVVGLVVFIGALFSTNSFARVRVGQNDGFLVVEASMTDCENRLRREAYDHIVERFGRFMTAMHSGPLKGKLMDVSPEHFHDAIKRIQKEILSFNADQRADEVAAMRTDYAIPGEAYPVRMPGDFNFPWTAKPTAWFLGVSKKLAATEDKGKAAAEATAALLDVARATSTAGASLANAGVTMMIGVVAVPVCQHVISKDAQQPTAEAGVEVHEGFWGGRWDMEPFLQVYLRGGVGVNIGNDADKPWYHISKYKPVMGLMWGYIEHTHEIAGGITAGGFNFNVDIPKVPGTWGQIGANAKFGCINNPQKTGILPIPWCDDYLFHSWKFERRNTVIQNGKHWGWKMNGKIDVGATLAGAAVVRWLGSAFNLSVEQQEEYIKSLDWLIDYDAKERPYDVDTLILTVEEYKAIGFKVPGQPES